MRRKWDTRRENALINVLMLRRFTVSPFRCFGSPLDLLHSLDRQTHGITRPRAIPDPRKLTKDRFLELIFLRVLIEHFRPRLFSERVEMILLRAIIAKFLAPVRR